jgi:redox-sensing transcriptional repressor
LGQRGVGYDARELANAIRAALGIDRAWRAVLIGVGNLGRALLKYQGFRTQGFEIVGLFDSDPSKVGHEVEGHLVEPVTALAERIPILQAELGVLTVPADTAQAVAETLVGAGIRGILNFAPVVLKLPRRVRLVTVDLAIQLEQLAFQVQHGDAANRTTDEE